MNEKAERLLYKFLIALAKSVEPPNYPVAENIEKFRGMRLHRAVEEVLDEAKQDFENLIDANYRAMKCDDCYYSFWNESVNLVKKWFGE